MKNKLKNNLPQDIQIGAVDTIGSGSPGFKFKKVSKKGGFEEFLAKDRYVAFKVPKGQGFKITSVSNLLFRFIQVKPSDPNNDDMDTYVYQVMNFSLDSEEKGDTGMGNGDADIDPPAAGMPING